MNIEETYDLYVDKVYKFFYIKCLDRSLAEDLTSATFMSYIERQKDETFIANDNKRYLYGIMRNTWSTYLRNKYRAPEFASENIDDFATYVELEIKTFESSSIKERAASYINLLPAKQQQIVSMRLLEELSIKDISKELDKDRNYVKTTYKRGLKRLRQLISDQEQVHTQALMISKESQ